MKAHVKPRTPLGELLLRAGIITPRDLEAALADHASSGRRLGSCLVRRGSVTAFRLTQVLSYQLSLPWVSLEDFALDRELLALVPAELAVEHRLVPVYVRRNTAGSTLYVATDDPTNAAGLEACAKAVGMAIRPMVAAPDAVSLVLKEHHGAPVTVAPPELESLAPEAVEEITELDLEVPAHHDPIGAVRAAVDRRSPTSAPPEIELGSEELADDLDAATPAGDAVIIVGARPAFLRQCREVVSGMAVEVEAAALGELESRLWRNPPPLALVVMEDVYAFDRVKFSKLALESGAPLVIWSDDLEPEFLAPVLETARRRATQGDDRAS